MAIDLQNLKILIIDDQKEARKMMRDMLMESGVMQIYEASDGREGLSFLDIAPDMIDLVICDWNMPKMSGVDLLRQLRSVDPALPFLMVTGRSDMSSVYEAKSAGVNGYIRKPFSIDQLEAKVRILYKKLLDKTG